MSISCTTLFTDVATALGRGTGDERLTSVFVRAVNRSLDQLSLYNDQSSRIAHITGIESSIALDAEYEYIVFTGIVYNMIRMGIRPGDPKLAAIMYADSDKNWEECKGDYWAAELNDRQSGNDTSIIALGYLGDT